MAEPPPPPPPSPGPPLVPSPGDKNTGPTPPEHAGGVLGRLRRQQPPAAEQPAQATHQIDPVTGALTREELSAAVTTAVRRSKGESSFALVAFVGIGLLRDINDSFGHDAGDTVLRQVTQRLTTIDVPGTKVLRYGGAEFVVVFEQIPNPAAGDEIGRFLIEFLSAPFMLGTDHVTIDPCVGAALSADNYDSLDDMIRDAHRSLVEAREQGRGTYVVHDESKRARYSTRIDDQRVYEAVKQNEFSLHYQPIIRLDTGDLIGVEALIRWSMPGATNTGMLQPHDFLPLLEKTGLIVKVGGWVLDEACRQAAVWNDNHPGKKRLFITCNLGARQLASTEFHASVVSALNTHGIAPWQLCLDITEPALRYNRDASWSVLRDLKDMGVKLSLDDFGTGVSSLTYLREFKLDLLRIDRSFVAGLEMSRENSIIIGHIASLAHDLNCHALAEGVETEEQANELRDLGVDLAQGYHFGRALPPDEINDMIEPRSGTQDDNPWDSANVFSNDKP